MTSCTAWPRSSAGARRTSLRSDRPDRLPSPVRNGPSAVARAPLLPCVPAHPAPRGHDGHLPTRPGCGPIWRGPDGRSNVSSRQPAREERTPSGAEGESPQRTPSRPVPGHGPTGKQALRVWYSGRSARSQAQSSGTVPAGIGRVDAQEASGLQ
jgi:hypothetical protein